MINCLWQFFCDYFVLHNKHLRLCLPETAFRQENIALLVVALDPASSAGQGFEAGRINGWNIAYGPIRVLRRFEMLA